MIRKRHLPDGGIEVFVRTPDAWEWTITNPRDSKADVLEWVDYEIAQGQRKVDSATADLERTKALRVYLDTAWEARW